MKRVARYLLRGSGVLMEYSAPRRTVEAAEVFLSAMTGKGGGSSWNQSSEVSALLRHAALRPGMTVFDIGANNGKWSAALAAGLARQDPQFHLFECAPFCFEDLEKNAREISAARIVRKAVSDSIGESTLHLPITTPGTGSGLASLHCRRDTSVRKHAYAQITVPTTTIDAYMAENAVSRVDILKVDVEGHEMWVLRGAEVALTSDRIGVVLFEFGSANVNSRTFFRDYWEFFNSRGFELFRITPSGGSMKIDHYDDRHEYFRGCSNFIACPRDRRAAAA